MDVSIPPHFVESMVSHTLLVSFAEPVVYLINHQQHSKITEILVITLTLIITPKYKVMLSNINNKSLIKLIMKRSKIPQSYQIS